METNLSYGGIPYNHSFVIDKVYDNRKAMDGAATDDGIFVGRYVLVSYTNEVLNQDEKIAIEVALNGNNPVGVYAGIITKNNVNNLGSRYNSFVTNYTIDRGTSRYNNTNYDKTIWRKYYRNGKQVYELVATLNSGLAINAQGVCSEEKVIQITQDKNNNNIIGTNLNFKFKDKTIGGQKQKHLILYSTPITGGTTQTEVASLDVTELIKDSFLKNVTYNKSSHTLVFTVQDDSIYGGEKEISINIDLMDAGNGISIETNWQDNGPNISLKLGSDNSTQSYLTFDEDGGLKLTSQLSDDFNAINTKFNALEDKGEYIKTLPKFTIETSGMGNVEVGTTVTPTAAISFADGQYKYPYPETDNISSIGATYKDVELKLVNKKSGYEWNFDDLPSLKLADNGEFEFVFSATIMPGSLNPVSNLGVQHPNKKYQGTNVTNNDTTYVTYIGAGATLKSYREGCFYGVTNLENFTVDQINSDFIRSLNKSGNTYSGKVLTSNFNIPIGTTGIIIACPEGKPGPTEVLNLTNNSKMTSLMGEPEFQVSVKGANDYTGISYNVWVYIPAEGYRTSQSLKITLGQEEVSANG